MFSKTLLLFTFTITVLHTYDIKKQFNPLKYSDSPTLEASPWNHDLPLKNDICSTYNLELPEIKPHKAHCNVKCHATSSLKCTLSEFEVPECSTFAAYVYKKLSLDFDILKQQKEFSCQVPTLKSHNIARPLQKDTKSPLCNEYRKASMESKFEFPCFVKCETNLVGVSLDGKTPDWNLDCVFRQQACSLPNSDEVVNMGTICEAYRQFILAKVKLGDSNYHDCNVYNHGPQFDYVNQTSIKHKFESMKN